MSDNDSFLMMSIFQKAYDSEASAEKLVPIFDFLADPTCRVSFCCWPGFTWPFDKALTTNGLATPQRTWPALLSYERSGFPVVTPATPAAFIERASCIHPGRPLCRLLLNVGNIKTARFQAAPFL